LHQGATVKLGGAGSSMSEIMLLTMLIMAIGFWFYSIATALSRVRCIILERERNSSWVQEVIGKVK
jgi:heme exporter protein C